MTGRNRAVQRRLRHGEIAGSDGRRGTSVGDCVQIGFAILVLAYFAAQFVRAAIQHGFLG